MIAVLLVLSLAGEARALEHPTELPAQAGCERWKGGSSGNDPSARLMFVLCPEGTNVTGEMQWSSLVSGWSVRPVEGSWNGDTLVMRDLRLSENRPQPGWRFCTVDRWELRRVGDRLEGTYDSAACHDHATVWLERMDDAAPGEPTPSVEPTPVEPNPSPPGDVPSPDMVDTPPSNVEPPAPDVPSMDPRPPPAETPRPAGCGCDASPSSSSLLPWLVWLVVRRRR